jgi:hypothetical protein
MYFLFCIFLGSSLLQKSTKFQSDYFPSKIQSEIKSPHFHQGTLSTQEGGVIYGENFWIQAKSINYTHNSSNHMLVAKENVLLQMGDMLFVGNSAEIDFIHKSICIQNGKMLIENWILRGEKIVSTNQELIQLEDGSITSSIENSPYWDIASKYIKISKKLDLNAESLSFRVLEKPIIKWPAHSSNLNDWNDPFIQAQFRWDLKVGPRISLQSLLFSQNQLDIIGRIDYRMSTGWGGTIETFYKPKNSNLRFECQNYVSTDRLESAPEKKFRYRFQGSFENKYQENTRLIGKWDKYSDIRLRSDFQEDSFECTSPNATALCVAHSNPNLFMYTKVRPKVNKFETIKQDLPSISLKINPRQTSLLKPKMSLKAAFLDYNPSRDFVANIDKYHSARIEFTPEFTLPIQGKGFTFTPFLKAKEVFYSASPQQSHTINSLLSYGTTIKARGKKKFHHLQHILEPYCEYNGYSLFKTKTAPYIFNIQDGMTSNQQIIIGLKNKLFLQNTIETCLDTSCLNFLDPHKYDYHLPYFRFDLSISSPFFQINWDNLWNYKHSSFQSSNIRILTTIDKDLAFSLEGRYRSKYQWRKCAPENYFLEAYEKEETLLNSPLADERKTVLTKIFYRITPLWEGTFESHHGWGRKNQIPYNELQIKLSYFVTNGVKCKMSYRCTDYTTQSAKHHIGFYLQFVR